MMQTIENEVSEGSEPKPAFEIDSEDAANWYLRKLANIEAEKQRVTANAAQIIAQLDSEADGVRYVYEGQLQEYIRRELAARGKRRKSVHFLQGTCAFRNVGPSLRIADAAAALLHAQNAFPAVVKTVPTLDTAAYRALAETALESGEVLPGIETTPPREAFSIRFGGKPE